MKTLSAILIALCVTAAARSPLLAQSNVDPTNKHSWAENAGWLNWRDAGMPAGAQGVVFEATHLRGFIWGENIGWVNVGNGAAPYANTTGLNYGVNVEPDGTLWGYAWGENIGWINFDGGALASPPNPARIEDNRLRGFAWGENIGWINLDDVDAFVGITPTCTGDLNNDGIVDATDLSILLNNFGCVGPACPADINNDNTVDAGDLSILLNTFGTNC